MSPGRILSRRRSYRAPASAACCLAALLPMVAHRLARPAGQFHEVARAVKDRCAGMPPPVAGSRSIRWQGKTGACTPSPSITASRKAKLAGMSLNAPTSFHLAASLDRRGVPSLTCRSADPRAASCGSAVQSIPERFIRARLRAAGHRTTFQRCPDDGMESDQPDSICERSGRAPEFVPQVCAPAALDPGAPGLPQ